MKKPEQKPLRPASRRWFRLLALAFPLVPLVALEIILRLFGFGYPTSFFLKSNHGGLIENQEFTKRFFPAGLARSPQPLVLSREKPANTTRIFVFGESAAMGDPEPSFGFGRILEVLLADRDPQRKVEVINVAVTAINSHVIREIARDCAPLNGDIWVVYMGNNEVVGPYGAGTVFGAQTPSLAFIRLNVAMKRSRVVQLLARVVDRLRSGAPARWEGMEMFLNQQVRQADPRMRKVYSHFSQNLDAIIRTGRDSGAKVWVCTVGSNLKDCPPFASQPEATASAEAEFRAGRASLMAGETNKAQAYFARARDLDTLRFRADSEMNGIVRKAADRADGFIDMEAALARASQNGIPGEEFFFEHVHFNFDGNYLLARTVAEKSAPAPQRPWLSRDECARRLAFTSWNEFQIVDEMVRRMELPPFTHQEGHAQRIERLREQRSTLEAQLKPDAHDGWVGVYRSALKQRPDDWVLHENFARVLQQIGDADGAERSWRRVTELLPHSAAAWYGLGNVLDGQGKAGEALACFQRALKANPSAVEARNGMGLALVSLGRGKEAVDQYQQALRVKPDFAEARVNLGLAFAQRGDLPAAIREYETALRHDSNSVAAHVNLGKALLRNGDTNGALAHYRDAVRLKPDNPVARFNLGNALAGEAAVEQFSEAVRLKPDFAEAHYNLAMELNRLGRYESALDHLASAARLAPNMAEAHFNLGVAYAKQKRFTEAVGAFEATLRAEPQNEVARQYLEQARRRSASQ